MYNRYRIEVEFDELWHAARPHSAMTKRASPTMEVFPDKPGPVIRNNAYDQRELVNLTGGMPSPPTVTPRTCSLVSAAIVVTRPLSLPAFAERLFRLLAVKVPIPMTCVQVLVRSDISISRGHAASPVSPQASRSFFVTSKEETSHQQNTHARCFPMGAASSRNWGEMISESGGGLPLSSGW